MKTILVVDDEEKIREVVVSYLQKDGFQTIEADKGNKALDLVRDGNIDLVILDLMLPDLSGEEVCKSIRQVSTIPIIMLTAKVTEDDRVQGLSLGADDYVIKPFSTRELIARVKANLRRAHDDTLLAETISFKGGDLTIHPLRHKVFKNSSPVALTPNEYKLLLTFARHPGRTFTREELVEKVLGFDFEGDARAIDQHVKNLRQKIESDPKNPEYVITVFAVGYRFAGGESE
ncbi:DNA-binding response regulator, OmpR family, contains REC and winged-helix (wHTH) domain [Paenibacillus catalpae]|uniref:DNA-binding response regulator, OmpR family, contains REC and winged-helix (WHTH) domain n=1 Tax=Paenibacillus catalpae TaxID=1045775 RepID=A0A1I1X5U0_9BACL|nr:response regulator transcription factor [Paenibacillus catalpae]SFE02749.1 DNA-binding response regulator, OmpR family, contains REC and winged-helix (wHTH) domain [Paenibacillus catalpae]